MNCAYIWHKCACCYPKQYCQNAFLTFCYNFFVHFLRELMLFKEVQIIWSNIAHLQFLLKVDYIGCTVPKYFELSRFVDFGQILETNSKRNYKCVIFFPKYSQKSI
jgi:hypothetical protein